MSIIGTYSIPVIIFITSITIMFSKKNLFDEFLKGARDGFVTSIKILPSLIILICATRMFDASGALSMICNFLGGITEKIGISQELLPIIIMRPISGSGTTAMINNLFSSFGPDSFSGRCASILVGSTDTIFYTLSVYFGSVNISKTRYALPASFILLCFCIITSIILTNLFFY